jgi:hypothetical protein
MTQEEDDRLWAIQALIAMAHIERDNRAKGDIITPIRAPKSTAPIIPGDPNS